MKYVLGFAFCKNKEYVVLIQKTHPEWQKGKFNGVGGKVENYEPVHDAMRREFKEETGVDIIKWDFYCSLLFGDVKVFCFRCFTDEIFNCKTQEEEQISIIPLSSIRFKAIIRNLKVLIPMALDNEFKLATIDCEFLPGEGSKSS